MLVREKRNVAELQRKAIKELQQYYTKKRVFHGTFELNLQGHVEYYFKNFIHSDIPDTDTVVFSRYYWAPSPDAR